jgi:hypothetical protein
MGAGSSTECPTKCPKCGANLTEKVNGKNPSGNRNNNKKGNGNNTAGNAKNTSGNGNKTGGRKKNNKK